jgi:hypothetical protein
MEPNSEDEHRRLIDTAGRALARASNGDDEAAVTELVRSVRESGDGQQQARDLVLLLFSECSGMVATLGSGESTPVQMQVFDSEGQELSIDDAEPPVRTAVRTLLAEVHGDTDAAAEQVEIALSSASPTEITAVLLQAIRWTMRLTSECLERDLPVPGWISAAVED